MPLYEFKCRSCGNIIEKIQPYNFNPPECCGESMKRGVGNLALVHWKGGIPTANPKMHNSDALSKAEHRRWQAEQKEGVL